MRLEILSRDNFTCCRCSNTEETLHVHHLRGYRKIEPWEYATDELATLCKDCHESEHDGDNDVFLAGYMIPGISKAFEKTLKFNIESTGFTHGQFTDVICELSSIVNHYGPDENAKRKESLDTIISWLTKASERMAQ